MRALVATVMTVLGPATYALAQSCAMCANSFGDNDPVQRAMAWSILFLLATPYTVVAAVALTLFLTYRRASGRRRGAPTGLGRPRARAVPGLEGEPS